MRYVVLIVNLLLIGCMLVFATLSKSGDLDHIRIFLLDYYVKEIIILYLFLALIISFFARDKWRLFNMTISSLALIIYFCMSSAGFFTVA